MENTFCVFCRSKTNNEGKPKIFNLGGNRVRLLFRCGRCGRKKSTFSSRKKLGL